MTQKTIQSENKRVCYACGSDKTYIHKKHYNNALWYSNLPIGWLCRKCYDNIIMGPNRHKKYNPRRMKFKERIIMLKADPRNGVCNLCRAVVPFDCGRTQMHHEEYDDTNPLAHTIEICSSWHIKKHPEIIKKRWDRK